MLISYWLLSLNCAWMEVIEECFGRNGEGSSSDRYFDRWSLQIPGSLCPSSLPKGHVQNILLLPAHRPALVNYASNATQPL